MKKPKVKAPIEDVPVEVVVPRLARVFNARVIAQAINPQWVYARGDDGEKIPVVVPRRLSGKLVGKIIVVEAITDNTGTSHRYVEIATS